jgi:hypothetical protein
LGLRVWLAVELRKNQRNTPRIETRVTLSRKCVPLNMMTKATPLCQALLLKE